MKSSYKHVKYFSHFGFVW